MKKVIRKTVGDNISDSHINKSYEMDIGVVDMIKWILIAAVIGLVGYLIYKYFCPKSKKSTPDKRNTKNSKDVPISKKDAYQFMELLEALDELNHSK